MSELGQLVAKRRLVTLTGPGGSGKTRLAMQLAASFTNEWPDGVWLFDFGSLTDPAQVPGLTASTLGVLVEPGADEVAVIAAHLRQRNLLLILDTCEHLLDAAAALSERLLTLCPDVSIMATSREPLQVAGEAVWRVPSLRSEEAVDLFADRATLAAPDFAVDTALADVREVCARVDHIPLAIELAAAWVRALPPAQIAATLDDSFRLLTGGPRAAVARHKALHASMAWSHALLDDDERVVFRRLAVFAGSFTHAAVAAVCDIHELDALTLVGRLFDKSLVTVRETGGGVRYRLLDTVRQYAEEQLQASGETETVRDRHLDHFLDLVETAEPGLDSDQDTWRRELDSHRDNIRAALNWGLSPGRADRGRRLAAAMARQWFIRGQVTDGLDFLTRAANLDSADRSALQGRLLAGIAMLGMVSGRVDLLAENAGAGLAIAGEVGAEQTRARCLVMLAWPTFFVDFEASQTMCAEARALAEAAGDPFARDWATLLESYSLIGRARYADAVTSARLAFDQSWPRGDRFCAGFAQNVELHAALATGDVRRAESIGARIIDTVTPLGDFFTVGTNVTGAAFATAMAGDLARARAMMDPIVRSIDEALETDVAGVMVPYGLMHLWDGDPAGAVHWFMKGVQRMSGDVRDWTTIRCLPGLVAALRRLGRTGEAHTYAATAVRRTAEFDSPFELAYALDEQARLFRDEDPRRARDLHLQALVIRRDLGLRTSCVDGIDALAALEADAGNHAEAVRLLATSDAGRDEMGYPRPPVDLPDHDALVAALRASLGDDGFEAAWQDGTGRSLDDTVAALTRGRGPRNRPPIGWNSLTPAEFDVVRLLSKGLSNPEIATKLYVSRSTVKTHLSRVFAKLGVANRTELATLAAGQLADGHE